MPLQQGYFDRIAARSEKLEEFDELARKALEERKLRYKEWKDWVPKLVPPTAARGWLRPKPRNPLATAPEPTERTMVDAYNSAGQRMSTTLSLVITSDPSQIPKTWKSDDV
jgi:hypothetical protein